MIIQEAMTLATFLADVGTIFTTSIGWVGTVGTTIASSPILLAFTAIPLVGLGIGMFKRLLNVQ